MLRALLLSWVVLAASCDCGGTLEQNGDEAPRADGGPGVGTGASRDGGSSAFDAGRYCSSNADCPAGSHCVSNGEFGGACVRAPLPDAGSPSRPFDAGTSRPEAFDAGSSRPPVDAGAPECVHTSCSPTACGVIADVCGGTVNCGVCANCSAVAAQYHGVTQSTELTDPAVCSSCPGAFSGFSALSMPVPASATTVALDGTAPSANACCWEVEGPSGGLSSGSATPDGSGRVSATLPLFCGHNTVRLICSNDAGRRVLVRELEAPCAARDLRVTLGWDDQGTDMELHLVRQGGHINTPDDCTWYTCVGTRAVSWSPTSSSNPRKDVDNVVTLGPENIYLETAQATTYHVLVEYWGGGRASKNDVTFAVREQSVLTMSRTLQVHEVWHVADVTFPSGTLTRVDSVTACAASWHRSTLGCDLALP